MYKHEALVQLFDAFKATDVSDVIKNVRKLGYMLSEDGKLVMRYNVLVLSFLSGMYWSDAVPGAGTQIGYWVRLWWQGVPEWRESGPPVRNEENPQEPGGISA